MNFADTIRSAGLLPRDVLADGRIHRCPTKTHPHRRNGWYLLHVDGRRGVWGDNAQAPREALGHWTEAGAEHRIPTAEEQERQRRAKEKDRAYRIQAIKSARAFWDRARPCTRLHSYLERKGLSALGTVGLRELDGWLVVPVMWRGRVISIQRIHPDGTKRFAVGAPVKGGHYAITRERAALTVVCEGLATGLAIYQCVRNAAVIVAFDAGNLLPVVQELKPHGNVILAADNDQGTLARRGFNPGLDKARNAAELIGAGVAYPEGIDGTDWCDALREYGPTGARRIERLILGASKYVPREVPA